MALDFHEVIIQQKVSIMPQNVFPQVKRFATKIFFTITSKHNFQRLRMVCSKLTSLDFASTCILIAFSFITGTNLFTGWRQGAVV